MKGDTLYRLIDAETGQEIASEIGEAYATGEVPDVRIDEVAELSIAFDGSELRKALQKIIEKRKVNEIIQSFETFVEFLREVYEEFQEFMKNFAQPLLKELATVFIESPPPSGCTREEWREAARLDAQRAEARANAYGRRWTAEKAREIMRRRKWKKSINARGELSGFSG